MVSKTKPQIEETINAMYGGKSKTIVTKMSVIINLMMKLPKVDDLISCLLAPSDSL